jgi:cardiolipin synthase
MDIRSFQLNLEVTLICYDMQVAIALQEVAADYLFQSRPLHLEEWQARPPWVKFFDNIARLTSALQ